MVSQITEIETRYVRILPPLEDSVDIDIAH